MSFWKLYRRSTTFKRRKSLSFLIFYAIACVIIYYALKTIVGKYESMIEDTQIRKTYSFTAAYNVDLNKPMLFELFESSFSNFTYPLNVDMPKLVDDYKKRRHIHIKPVNLFPYKYITKSENTCKTRGSHKGILLLIAVKSALRNSNRRSAIRKTWCQKSFYPDLLRCVFVVGNSEDETLQNAVIGENYMNKDILQIDFKDSYYNNTLKTMGRFKWAVEYCKEAKFVLFVDDDFFVATGSLLSYLEDLKSYKTDHLFMGNVFDFPRPYRSPKSKWSVSIQEYPYEKYPSFVSAGAVLMSMSFVQDFTIAMQYTKRFKYDDIFMAIVAYKLRVIPVGSIRFRIRKVNYQSPYFEDILASHGYDDPEELHKAWSCLSFKVCT